MHSGAAPRGAATAPPWSEADRLAALRRYGVLDTPPEPAFDEITRIAALVCQAPIAVVNLIEETRQFFKAEIGLGVRETPVDISICAHAILQHDVFVVPDTTKDARFASNPLVTGEPHLRFYAGALLRTPEGLPIGTVCVLDHKPRPDGITPEQAETLRALARQVMTQLELRDRDARLREQAQALAESEAKFRAITDSIDQMIWSTRPDGFHDFYNRRWYEYTGVPEGSTDGEAWNGMFHPEDQERAWAAWRESLATGEPYEIEYRLRHRSGQYRWVLGRAQPVRDAQTNIVRWFGTCTDIHDLTHAQQALAASEQRFRTLVEVSPQVVWFGDASGAITYCNPYWYALTGLSPEYTSGNGWTSVIHPEHRERVLGEWRTAVHAEETYEVEIPLRRASDGQYRWFVARGQPIRDGRTGAVTQWIGIALDIHERKQAEEVHARLAAIVSSSSDAIISYDPEKGRLLSWNKGAEDTFGYTAEEAIGAPVTLLVPQGILTEQEDVTGVFNAVMAHGSARLESVRKRKDGGLINVSIAATRMTDEQGRVLGVAGIFRDITDQKRAEERQQLLVRELHHRVKNTLATVQAIAGSTARSVDTMDEFRARFSDRLISMGRTHTLITENAWQGAGLRDLLRLELDPYDDGSGERIKLDGSHVYLPPDTALALGLGFHELTTNAAKHGALSALGGKVTVGWHTQLEGNGETLRLKWTETDGPPVSPPTRRGFGSQLLQRVLGTQVNGTVRIDHDPAGLRVEIELPLTV